MDQYRSFIHKSRYARWMDKENRRETWEETVTRYIGFWKQRCPQVSEAKFAEIQEAILTHEIMPSMRAMMTAGKALERDHSAGYNCCALAVDHPRAFDETLYLLACGCGVGFSVERQFTNLLPAVSESFHDSDTVITVQDSKLGWAGAFKELISLLFSGEVPTWDMSKVRLAGARLKTFGGRASGPEPLDRLFKYTVALFKKAAGRKLSSLECHDLMCKIADTIVVGGVRRSALISLSNLSDDRMRGAKSGQWWEAHPERALANNSTAYTEKPEIGAFMDEWKALYDSKSGERGIVNRVAAKKAAIAGGRRNPDYDFLVNPCSEIFLRPNGFCNLSEVVIRAEDTLEDLARKVGLAAVLGTMQSTLTDFRYLRSIWKRNAEEERLLGVSLTGIMDHTLMNGSQGTEILEEVLRQLRDHAIEVNAATALTLGINPSVAITTVKPSGTVSQLTDAASGIHPRYSEYYIRTVRGDKKDPLSQMLFAAGVPAEDEARRPNDMWVFSFPQKAPEGAVLRNDRDAIQQLELYKSYKAHWAEHNVSITVYVKEHEWLEVGAWVYRNWDLVGGVSFLPHDEGTTTYVQAPYQEIGKEAYEALVAQMPVIDWDRLKEFEKVDATVGSQTAACSAGGCDLVDIMSS
jgi:ribonucleoside-diphosphate reductase alpha chain